MQLLLKRLEIVRAAMALEDESLLALQLPTLQAALTQMDAATSAYAALAEIIRLLQGRHYPEAVARIGAFLTAQTALVGYLDEQQTALRFELSGLEREITTQTLERDEMLEKMERFNRAFLAQCGAPLQEIFRLREAIARLELEKLRRAAEEDEALYQALAEAQAARQAFEEDKQQSEAAQAAEPPAAELDADEEGVPPRQSALPPRPGGGRIQGAGGSALQIFGAGVQTQGRGGGGADFGAVTAWRLYRGERGTHRPRCAAGAHCRVAREH